jgi:curli biogenesis system outer membrane secretion channel CsgG
VQPINYTGPRQSIAVGEIENRTGVQTEVIQTGTTIQTGADAAGPVRNVTVRNPIGSGMRDQLITALTQTGVFNVSSDTYSARYVLRGAVTEYEPSQASIAGGYGWGRSTRRTASDPTIGGGNLFVQVLMDNAMAGFAEQDHIAMNIHLVDTMSNAIVASTTVEAKPTDIGAGGNLLFGGMRKFFDGGMQMKTPMQKAIRACMGKTAEWAAQTVVSMNRTAPAH